MKKKVVIYYLIIRAAIRLGAIAILLFGWEIEMPISVLLSSSVLSFAELGIAVWYFAKYVSRQKLATVLSLDTLLVIINLFTLSFVPISIGILETIISGTLLDILVNIVLMVLVLKGRKYVVIKEPRPRRTRKAIDSKRAKTTIDQ